MRAARDFALKARRLFFSISNILNFLLFFPVFARKHATRSLSCVVSSPQAVEAQSEQFRRYGVWGDFGAPYLTLDKEYEAAQIGVFGCVGVSGHF